MIDAIRSEWIKLMTLTVNKVLIAVAIAFPVVVTSLVALLSDDLFFTGDVVDLVAGLTMLSSLIFGVVAAVNMAGEFGHNTIRPTFAALPVRIRPLLAKLILLVAVTFVLILGVIIVCWMIMTNVADGDFPLEEVPGFGSPKAALLGSALFALGTTLGGFALGNLIRNMPAAVTFLLLWPLVIENILARLLFSALDLEWEKYLPFTQGLTLGFIDRSDSGALMTRTNGALYFFVVLAAITVLGVVRTQRSDA